MNTPDEAPPEQPKPKLEIDPNWSPDNSLVVSLWREYRGRLYKTDNLPPSQERECSLAFFSGMTVCLLTMLNLADSNDEEKGSFEIGKLRRDIIQANIHARLQPSVK